MSDKIGSGQRAVIYARTPQFNEHDRTAVEVQLTACLALAEHLGYTVEPEAVLQEDTPNSSLVRPGMTKLIGLVAQKQGTAVITYTLDRLGRLESEGLEALLRELRRRSVPIFVSKVPMGYSYDPATGKLIHDPALVAAANREDARPPEYIVIPRETEQHDSMADLRALRTAQSPANGRAESDPGQQ
jgi:DNA invertase Pin-like site-specific DNA recombinase